jgi:hypothetical protein
MREHTRIQRKREKATAFPLVQSDAVQDSPFASQHDVDEVPSNVQEVLSSTGQPLDAEHLLAHELTHVVQQKDDPTTGKLTLGSPTDTHEQKAESQAAQVVTSSYNEGDEQYDNNASAVHAGTSITRIPGNLLVQRQPGNTQARLNDIEQRQHILEKRQSATELDSRWRAKFGERIASYRQAILRISGGLDAATQGFQAAQVAQAQTDALETQLIGAVVAIGFAVGFEWVFGAALANLDIVEKRAEKVIETVENPANAAVSGGVNVAGVVTGMHSASAGQTPAVSPTGGAAIGGAMAFLTSNLETLEHHSQLTEQAFINRAEQMQGFSDEQWEKFDPATQESTYRQLLTDLNNAASGEESLKPPPAVAQILERHLWALWIKSLHVAEVSQIRQANEQGMASGSGPLYLDESKAVAETETDPQFSIGTDIEVRLNQVGISELAGVTLTGHWFSSNSPGNWKAKLLEWANAYRETLKL